MPEYMNSSELFVFLVRIGCRQCEANDFGHTRFEWRDRVFWIFAPVNGQHANYEPGELEMIANLISDETDQEIRLREAIPPSLPRLN